jgi:hypothetical protein
MTTTSKLRRSLVGLFLLAALLALPTLAAAASSSFIVPFAMTLMDPCTNELVDITGASTVTIAETVDKNGQTKTAVSVTTRGTGVGQVSLAQYPFTENQNFTVKAAVIGEAFDSAFSDKLSLKGPGSVDNFVVRAFFRIKIDTLGNIQVSIENMNSDVCKG